MKKMGLLLVLLFSMNVFGISDEDRVINLSKHMRCLTCDNQSVYESNSDFSLQFLLDLNALIKQGKSDQNIYEIMVDEYGDSILYNPKMNRYTLFLWFAPLLLLILGLYIFFNKFYINRRKLNV